MAIILFFSEIARGNLYNANVLRFSDPTNLNTYTLGDENIQKEIVPASWNSQSKAVFIPPKNERKMD